MNPLVLVTLTDGLVLTRVVVAMPVPIANTETLLLVERAARERLETSGHRPEHLRLVWFQRLEE